MSKKVHARFDLLDSVPEEDEVAQVEAELKQPVAAPDNIQLKALHTCYYVADVQTCAWLQVLTKHLDSCRSTHTLDKIRDVVLLMASMAYAARTPSSITLFEQPWFPAPSAPSEQHGAMHYYNCPITAFVQWTLWMSYRVWCCALSVLDPTNNKPLFDQKSTPDEIKKMSFGLTRLWLWYFDKFNKCYAFAYPSNKHHAAYAMDLMCVVSQTFFAIEPQTHLRYASMKDKEKGEQALISLARALWQCRNVTSYVASSNSRQDHPWVVNPKTWKVMEALFYSQVGDQYSRIHQFADAEWAYTKAMVAAPQLSSMYLKKREQATAQRMSNKTQEQQKEPYDFNGKYWKGNEHIPLLCVPGELDKVVLYDQLFRKLEGVFVKQSWLPTLNLDRVPVVDKLP